MTKETTNRQVQELYPESDAATKRSLEGLANSISQFREAVRHIAEQQAAPSASQWEQAQRRKQATQRRVMLEWVAAMVLCVALLLPGIGYYRSHSARVQEQQAEMLKQQEADAVLLDQVTSEISETVPDSMRPLAEMDSDYASNQISTGDTEKKNGTK
jgi:Tfp pilus assembly protein PilN